MGTLVMSLPAFASEIAITLLPHTENSRMALGSIAMRLEGSSQPSRVKVRVTFIEEMASISEI